jgi:flagellar hook-basal body complex protein FliE
MNDLQIIPVPPVSLEPATPSAVGPARAGFGEALGRALEHVNRLQLQAEGAAVALASGERVDMVGTLVAVEKANIAFQFALQIRNKLVEAYQEIMRLQV